MAVAAAEVYPKETIGILIGLRGDPKVWVEYAVPMQTAEREEDSVDWKRHIEHRVKRFMTGTTGLEVVGHFHSHPYPQRKRPFSGMNQLSERDLKSWKPPEIELVVGVTKNLATPGKGSAAWKHLKVGSLQGTIGDYAMRMTSWFSRDGKQKKPKIAFIRCPFATGMDQ
jgi:hypothetical protein